MIRHHRRFDKALAIDSMQVWPMPAPDCRRYGVSSNLVALLRSASPVNQRMGLRSLSPRLDLHTSKSRNQEKLFCAIATKP